MLGEWWVTWEHSPWRLGLGGGAQGGFLVSSFEGSDRVEDVTMPQKFERCCWALGCQSLSLRLVQGGMLTCVAGLCVSCGTLLPWQMHGAPFTSLEQMLLCTTS